MKHGNKIGIAVILTTLIASCSSGYHKDFSCSEFPELGCRTTESVFEESENGIVDYRKTSEKTRKSGKKRSKKDVQTQINIAPNTPQMNYITPGDPVLTLPQVMRVLIFPWQDKEADLNAGGYIYVRLGDPEWLILKK